MESPRPRKLGRNTKVERLEDRTLFAIDLCVDVSNIGANVDLDPVDSGVDIGAHFQDAKVLQIDGDLGLRSSENYFDNWKGWNEKWIQGRDFDWFFVTQHGGVYEWNPAAKSLGENIYITHVDKDVYRDPSILHDASERLYDAGGWKNPATRAENLDRDYWLTEHHDGTFDDWMERDEKWMVDRDGDWYYVTPDGDFYSWSNADGSNWIARIQGFEMDEFDDLLNSYQPSAYAVDEYFGFEHREGDNYSYNWGGLEEKWLQAADQSWFYITPDGNVYKWLDNTMENNRLIATLNVRYYDDPELLASAADLEELPLIAPIDVD